MMATFLAYFLLTVDEHQYVCKVWKKLRSVNLGLWKRLALKYISRLCLAVF